MLFKKPSLFNGEEGEKKKENGEEGEKKREKFLPPAQLLKKTHIGEAAIKIYILHLWTT